MDNIKHELKRAGDDLKSANRAVYFTLEEIEFIEDLIARNEPEKKARDGDSRRCPSCGSWVYSSDRFCSKCGQRFAGADTEKEDGDEA